MRWCDIQGCVNNPQNSSQTIADYCEQIPTRTDVHTQSNLLNIYLEFNLNYFIYINSILYFSKNTEKKN